MHDNCSRDYCSLDTSSQRQCLAGILLAGQFIAKILILHRYNSSPHNCSLDNSSQRQFLTELPIGQLLTGQFLPIAHRAVARQTPPCKYNPSQRHFLTGQLFTEPIFAVWFPRGLPENRTIAHRTIAYRAIAHQCSPIAYRIIAHRTIAGQLFTGQLLTGQLLTGQLLTRKLLTGQMLTGQLLNGKLLAVQILVG